MDRYNSIFICSHCHKKVDVYPVGTKQRNHCPYCLWSLHLDEKLPGDRKSHCHGQMDPVGLTTKKYKANKYPVHLQDPVTYHIGVSKVRTAMIGEIVIVHRCLQCGTVTCNRLAGDDKVDEIIKLLDKPVISVCQRNTLTRKDLKQVKSQLLGNGVSADDS